ncbi:type II toxin-antitoxin system VapC family toxin [Leptospira wolffii]|uniref:type II toxin-antitoxin system VapC family toxin n=1 Tax=Leptospira wolffii TaxID=409998 RepID=UPI0002F634CC|nr:type II toxin-antitoxin system VapC family toxin [Leptospira wolffii]EPG67916.1 PIN domain protein [Leptospira wolffii serovar Khorat str. Khorat-H2]
MVSLWVLDCSLAAASFLPDEQSGKADRFLGTLGKTAQAIVPSLWWYEFNNVLLVSRKRKRLNDSQSKEIVSIFESLPLEFDSNFSFEVLRHIQDLAYKNDLSAYDASYLELCIRKGAGLATLDEKLGECAKKLEISLYSSKNQN